MAASKGQIGYGSKLQLSIAAVFTDIAEVTKISFTGSGAAPVDITHMQSDNGYKEWATGSIDPGEVSAEMNYVWDDAAQIALTAALVDRAAHAFRVIYKGMTTGKYISFNALVTKFGITGETEGKLTASATLKITGPITYPTP